MKIRNAFLHLKFLEPQTAKSIYMPNLPYKTRSDLSDINQNNLINSNLKVNEAHNSDNIMFISPSNYANRKYKTEKRMNREKDEYYTNMQKNSSDFMQNKNIKPVNVSSSDENDNNGVEEVKYQNSNNLRNNYGNSLNNNNYRNFQMNEDINNNYYSKDNYIDNEDRMMNIKRDYNDIGRKGKNVNDNYNDSNQMPNNYYK